MFILPPPLVDLKEIEQLDLFFAKERRDCMRNLRCKCGKFVWCANYNISSDADWRIESLPIGEQILLQFQTFSRGLRTTFRPSRMYTEKELEEMEALVVQELLKGLQDDPE